MSPATVRPAPSARYALLGSTMFLALGGLLMIYSASFAADYAKYHDSAYHLKPQAEFLALGLVVMWACSRLTPDMVRRAGWWVLGAADIALVGVLVSGVGKFGATRWLDLGFTTVQPSEFAKLGVVLVLADILADRERGPRPIKYDLGRLLLAVVPPFVLVMLQPDMGTAMSILMAAFFVLVLGGLQMRYVIGTAVGIAAAIPLLIIGKEYRATRFLGFLDPAADPLGKGYQIIQARLAFGSGGLLGLGLGLSRQKFFYLPAAHTDFIFAIIGEELGLMGTLAVVLAFGVFCFAGMRIALSLRDAFSRFVAGGLTLMIVTAAVLNMASVTGIIPVTGIPLPLVSYGGSSMLFTMGCIGLILAMTRGRERVYARQRPAVDSERGAGASTGERRWDGRPHLSGIDGGRAGQRRGA